MIASPSTELAPQVAEAAVQPQPDAAPEPAPAAPPAPTEEAVAVAANDASTTPQLAQVTAYPTYAQPAYSMPVSDPWQTYKVRLAALARQQGVREATIQSTIPGLEINHRVIALDHAEPLAQSSGGVPSMQPYIRTHVTASLISRGQSNYNNHYQGLRWIESRYGVDPTILLAIYGHETSYGRVTGNNDLLEVLASMAYGGRRRALFENEFISALKLMDQGVPRYMLKGSWAGATPISFGRVSDHCSNDPSGPVITWASFAMSSARWSPALLCARATWLRLRWLVSISV